MEGKGNFVRHQVLKDSFGRDASSGEVWLFDPDLVQVKTWKVADLECLEHGRAKDGLKASSGGTKHGIIVPVPVSMMEKAGTYYFVLHFLDNHPDKYKDHKVKPALEVNATWEEPPPIVYIKEGIWHVAWCRPGRDVTFRTVRAHPARYCVVRDFTNATPLSSVRAAINGGFFYPFRPRKENDPPTNPEVRMVAEVGTGTAGKWQYGIPLLVAGSKARPGRWCFGMTAKGEIRVSKMEVRKEKDNEGKVIRVFRVHRNIENLFPYGLSGVGLLVQNGRTVEPPPHWPIYPAPRTALAWTTSTKTHPSSGRHVFFVTSSTDVSWDDTATFIHTTLPKILQDFFKTRIDSSSISAVMLDGGGGTKFGYRLNPGNPSTYRQFPRHQHADAPNSIRYLTTYITAEAKFQE